MEPIPTVAALKKEMNELGISGSEIAKYVQQKALREGRASERELNKLKMENEGR